MKQTLILGFVFAIGAVFGHFASSDDSKSQLPKGQLVSYQASIIGGHSKIGNAFVAGATVNQKTINDTIGIVLRDTNVVNGSIVILNSIPIY